MTVATPSSRTVAVVCRHDQLLAAAAVLSCFPPGVTPCLLVHEPQPHDHGEYKRRYARFRENFDRRNELIGGEIGWKAAGASRVETLRVLQAAVDDALQDLGPYRSWYAHQLALHKIVDRVQPAQALLLFDGAIDALKLMGIGNEELADGAFTQMLPAGTPTYQLAVADDAELEAWVQAAWLHLRPGEAVPDERVACRPGDAASCLCALRDALRLGQPLRSATGRGAAVHQARGDSADEVVLLEARNSADLLLGVLYAARSALGVVAYAAPDRKAIDAAIDAVEQQRQDDSKHAQSQANTASNGKAADHPKLIGEIRRWFASRRAGSLEAVALAVSRAVPAQVPALVGDAAVTVMTDGIPYRFLRVGGMQGDWAEKPVGHISGDRALLMLNALHPPPPEAVGTFDMMFDPGFFEETAETRDVLNALAGRRSYALVLKRETGSSASLMHLTRHLPVELIYFNTHGSRQGIALSDQVIPSYKLAQWLSLPSSPVIFNSSCLSWLGVGTEFVRCGARGYVGTLWSVLASDAADLARQSVRRMVRDGQACSAALCKTGVDPMTAMAYLFVGTASQRLQGAEPSPLSDAERARSHGLSLLLAAQAMLDSHGQLRSDDHRRSTVNPLLAEADRMIDDVMTLDAASSDTFDLLMRRRVVTSLLPTAENGTRMQDFLDDAEQRVQVLAADNPQRWRLAWLRAQWLEAQGRPLDARDHLKAVTLPDGVAHTAAAALERRLSDLYKKTGQAEQALAAAQRALAINERVPGDNRVGVMASLGDVVQATLRLAGREAEALAIAERGLTLAGELHHDGDETVFELDIARIHHVNGQPALGEPFARSALKRARRNFENLQELAAVGSLCNILIATGRLDEAATLAQSGLDEAQKLQRWTSVGDFLSNMAHIERRRQQPQRAFAAMLAAARLFGSQGLPERLQEVFHWVANDLQLPDDDALGGPDLRVAEVAFVVASTGEGKALHWPVAFEGVRVLHRWARAQATPPPAAVFDRLLAHEPKNGRTGPAELMGMTVRMLYACAAIDSDNARAWATHLDQATGGQDFTATATHTLERWKPTAPAPQ